MTLRDDQATATREQLIEAGSVLFGSQGYSAVAASDIVKHAGVTRGALYHHFKDGKRDLFSAVAERQLQHLIKALAHTAPVTGITWNDVPAIFETFFECASTQAYMQIVLKDAPSVLGSEQWRALEHDYSVGFIKTALDLMGHAGLLRIKPTKTLALLIFGACCEAAIEIAYSDDPQSAKSEAINSLMTLLAGLRLHTE